MFVVEGEGLDADELETELDRLGDSLMVVGDPSALKVHVHTDDPGAALSLGAKRGILEGIAAGRLCVDMSTIDPGTSRRVAARLGERGIRFLDAPVSGGVGAAGSSRAASR